MLDTIEDGRVPFDKHQLKYFFVIQQLLAQQKAMFKDKIYLNRSNRAWLKERNIRHTGDPLGRKPVKTVKSYYMKRKERREAAERNQIEGKFGQGKSGYNLNPLCS